MFRKERPAAIDGSEVEAAKKKRKRALVAEGNLFRKGKLVVEKLFLARAFTMYSSGKEFTGVCGGLSEIDFRSCVEGLGQKDSEMMFSQAFFHLLSSFAGLEGWSSSKLAARRLGQNSFVTYYEYATTGVTRKNKRKLGAASAAQTASDNSDSSSSDTDG